MPTNRLPKLTFSEGVKRKVQWWRDWTNLAQKYQIELNPDGENLKIGMKKIINRVRDEEKNEWVSAPPIMA